MKFTVETSVPIGGKFPTLMNGLLLLVDGYSSPAGKLPSLPRNWWPFIHSFHTLDERMGNEDFHFLPNDCWSTIDDVTQNWYIVVLAKEIDW